MNPRIKRLLSMFLALTMVFSLLPVSASAASTTHLPSNTVEIEVGETATLKVSGIYSKTTWASSDDEIATVSSDGAVTGIAPGTATITATSKGFGFWGKTTTTKFTVIVTEPENREKVTVKVGEIYQLSIAFSGGSVTWKSSDKNIAFVDAKGLVTGVSEGDVIITATEKKVTGNPFFWWGGGRKTVITTTEFKVTVLPGEEQPTQPSEPSVITYTVNFETNGGSEVADQLVQEGQPAAEPEEPTREGYTFEGWYTDEDLTLEYDFTAAVSGNMTLYAKWNANGSSIPTMPENPSKADEYYFSTSDVIEVIKATESESVPTEADVVKILTERGFSDYSVICQYAMDGSFDGETNASRNSVSKHPMYLIYYITEDMQAFTVYVINGEVFAYPVSFSWEAGRKILLSESTTLTCYDAETNKFYVTVPHEDNLTLKQINRIDAQTLENLTYEEVAG